MIKTSTRPDRRRAAKAEAKREQYSGRHALTATYYAPGWVARSKYMPHIGSKERGRYAA